MGEWSIGLHLLVNYRSQCSHIKLYLPFIAEDETDAYKLSSHCKPQSLAFHKVLKTFPTFLLLHLYY